MNDGNGVAVIMAYGLRIKDASGNILLNSADLIVRIRYYTVALSGNSGNVVLSDIAGKTTYAFSIPLTAGFVAPHAVSVSGTTFSWTAQSTAHTASADSLVGVIIAS